LKHFFAALLRFKRKIKRTKQAVPAYLQPVQLRGEPRHDRVRSIHVIHCILKGVPCDGEGEANPAQEQLEQKPKGMGCEDRSDTSHLAHR
jgi:hypothetical protein